MFIRASFQSLYIESGKVYSVYNPSPEEKASLNTIWNSFDKTSISSKTIVVRDGSGSMYDCEAVSANCVATSLALLFAERLTGEFKNKFITFSSRPRIIEVKGNDIYEKYKFISKYDDISSTNIEAVYNLIFKVYQNVFYTLQK